MRPMKADTCPDDYLDQLKLPLFASLKLDGIRCVVKEDRPLSSALKPIRNCHVYSSLSHMDFNGLDGELLIQWPGGGIPPFNEVSSAIMGSAGTPNFVFNVFDIWNLEKPFILRYDALRRRMKSLEQYPFIKLLPQVLCETLDEVLAFEREALEAGHEGIMLRSMDGPYKFGESTLKQQYLLKRKPFADAEARIIGFVEQLRNENEATTDNLGKTKRSTCKENMVGKGTLGKFIVTTKTWGEFHIGKGSLTDAKAQYVWDHQDEYLGKLSCFKYQVIGLKDKPRIAVHKGFRDPDDLSPEKLEAI